MDTSLPVFCDVTEGRVSDHYLGDHYEVPKGSVIVADRGYFKTSWLKDLDSRGVFFVIRMKVSTLHEVTEGFDITDEKAKNLLSDEDIRFLGQHTSLDYAGELRCVRFLDYDDKEVLVVTNNFQWKASTVQNLYKKRWAIETFFKEVKQNLSIKSFCGTSYNAVMIQVWTTMTAMMMIKYLKLKSTFKWSTSNLVQQIRIHLLVKIDFWTWLDEPLLRHQRPPPDIQIKICFD
jgi:IS4 transposase